MKCWIISSVLAVLIAAAVLFIFPFVPGIGPVVSSVTRITLALVLLLLGWGLIQNTRRSRRRLLRRKGARP